MDKFIIITLLFLICEPLSGISDTVNCNNLRMGQYLCPDPEYDLVDPKTQQIRGCTKENKARSKTNK